MDQVSKDCIRRRQDGSIDTDFYLARGRDLRCAAWTAERRESMNPRLPEVPPAPDCRLPPRWQERMG